MRGLLMFQGIPVFLVSQGRYLLCVIMDEIGLNIKHIMDISSLNNTEGNICRKVFPRHV